MSLQEPKYSEIMYILKKHFPNAEITGIERINKGYTHFMYKCVIQNNCRADDKTNAPAQRVILRIGYNKAEEYSIAKEQWVMNKYLEAKIPVPKTFAFDTTRSEVPFEYALIQRFEGNSMADVWDSLSRKDKIRVMTSVGKFLAQMHSVSIKQFGNIGPEGIMLKEHFAFRQSGVQAKKSEWVSELMRETLKHFSELIAYDLLSPEQSSTIIEYLHKKSYLVRSAVPVLAHMDFLPEHVFIEKKGQDWLVTGICDFEFASAFAREFDFVKLHRLGYLDDPELKNALFTGYGRSRLHSRTDEIIEFYRVCRDIGFARFTAKSGNIEVSNKTLQNILKLVSSE